MNGVRPLRKPNVFSPELILIEQMKLALETALKKTLETMTASEEAQYRSNGTTL